MKLLTSFSICLVIFLRLGFVPDTEAQSALPLPESIKIKPLRNQVDSTLYKDLLKELDKNPQWNSLIKSKRMAVGLVDMKDPKSPRYAAINENHMMYAASLPKIAVLLAAMDAFEKKELKETAEIRSDMKLMISKSDNAATTRMIDRLGMSKIEAVMLDPKYDLYNENYGGGLWVGKRYGRGGATNREPLKNLSHAATASQVCRFYYMLSYGKLVNRERSKQMLQIMEDPALHHKFVNSLNQIAPGARIFRKSGSWKTYHSDSVLVWGKDPNRRYILVALVDDPSGEQIMRSLVKRIEAVLKI